MLFWFQWVSSRWQPRFRVVMMFSCIEGIDQPASSKVFMYPRFFRFLMPSFQNVKIYLKETTTFQATKRQQSFEPVVFNLF